MPRGQTPKQRRFRKETKPLRKATRTLKKVADTMVKKTPIGIMGTATKMGLGSEKLKDLLKKQPGKKKTNGRRGSMVENYRANRKAGRRAK